MPTKRPLPLDRPDPRERRVTCYGNVYRIAPIGHNGEWMLYGDGVPLGAQTSYENAYVGFCAVTGRDVS